MESSQVQAATVIGPTAPPAAPASSALDVTDSHSEDENKISSVPPPRILGPSMPSDIAPPAPKRQKIDQEIEEEDDNFGPSLPTAADVLRVVYSAPTFDPLLGTAPPSSALMGKSIEAPTALTTSEKDAWERLRSDPNATLANLNPTEREEWMLKLPDGGQKHALDYDAMQQSITSFSRKGAVKHAVDATWGESPADKAKREASTDAPKSSLELAKQMVAERLAREKAEQTAKTIEEYNSKHRAKTLMEIAAEEKTKQAKEAQDKERRRAERAKEKEKRKSKDKHRKSKDKDKRDKRKRKEKKRKRRDSSSSDSDSDSSSSSSSDSRDTKSSKKKSASSSSDPQVAFNPYGFGAGPSAPAAASAGYWDRERDMSSSRFDAVKKQSAIKDSKMLNQKFAPSNASRFM